MTNNTRVVKKSKGGVQDLLLGKGKVLQDRAGGTYEIDRLDVPVAVNSLTEMEALDTEYYTRARVYADEVTFDDYIYDSVSAKWDLAVRPLKKLSTTEHKVFIGASAELTVDTTEQELVLHDGVTQGGKTIGIDKVKVVNSVADLAGFAGTKDDQQISLKGWHPDSDVGGGILYWDAAKPKSEHNGGTVFSPTVPFSATTGDYLDGVGETDAGGSGCWVRTDCSFNIDVVMFGATGDGITDDTESIQACLIYGAHSIYSAMTPDRPLIEHGHTYTGTTRGITFSTRTYIVSETLRVPGTYPRIDGNESVVIGSGLADDVLFNLTEAYQCHFSGFRLVNVKNALRIKNENLGMGKIDVKNIHMQGGDTFLELYARSSGTLVSDCRLDAVKHPLVLKGSGTIGGADMVTFESVWYVPAPLSTDYDGFFRIETNVHSPRLILRNFFYNPMPQTAKDVVVIRSDADASIDVDSSLFGGEAGQVSLIGWHAEKGSIGLGRGSAIRIKDSTFNCLPSGSASNIASGNRPIVELYTIPNLISFENVLGNAGDGFVNFRDDFRTITDAKSINTDCEIHFLGKVSNSAVYFTVGAFKKIGCFVRTKPKTFFGYLENLNNSTVPSDAAKISIPLPELKNFKLLRVCITLNPNELNTYSEYRVSTDFTGNFTGLEVVHEGSSSKAPRIFIDSGSIYARTESATVAEWDFDYSIEQICGVHQFTL